MAPTTTVPTSRDAERERLTLRFLARLRWGALAGGVAAVLVAAHGMATELPVGILLGGLGLGVLTNAGLEVATRREPDPSPWLALLTIGFDGLLLTALLALSGGASNPFSAVYLVYVTLAAVVLRGRWPWLVVALTVAGYGSLFLLPADPGAHAAHAHHGHSMAGGAGFQTHLYGMFIAFAVCAVLIVGFVTRTTQSLREREAQLAHAREAASRNQRLASLTTLAAGAAHELASPLSTIAVVARELERAIDEREDGDALADDARLVRSEVDRCRAILDAMAARAGRQAGEARVAVSASELVASVREGLSEERARRLRADVAPGVPPLSVPPEAFAHVVRALVRNAFDASPDDREVTVAIAEHEDRIHVAVRDRGHGMEHDVRARAVEPFFSTKERGQGLGLFLATTLADSLGGRLSLESAPGDGTTATLEIPR